MASTSQWHRDFTRIEQERDTLARQCVEETLRRQTDAAYATAVLCDELSDQLASMGRNLPRGTPPADALRRVL